MHNAELLPPQPLARKAVIYFRQSTPHPVVSHQESLRLQSALHARARPLGGPAAAIDSIDDDRGLPAASAAHREGFNPVVAQGPLAQGGLIVSYEVTRLSRNCSDWKPLLDLCGDKGCLSADGDGSYEPATVNGRLLWGLQGTLSAWERPTMQARRTAGLLHKAQRGELALPWPTGLVRNGQGQVRKIPTQEAQARLALVFDTVVPCRSARQGVDGFQAHPRWRPRRDRGGALVGKAPRVAAVLAILKPPA
jgi:DNA invertase Pin-like site-specific DNA recombinase